MPLGTHPPRDPHRQCEKLGVVAALLAAERYGSVLDIGCGRGELGQLLRERCARYCGMEADITALARARGVIGGGRFVPLSTPFRLPSGAHELVVLNEVLHLLDESDACLLGRALEAHAACREIVVVSPCGDGEHGPDRREPAFARFADALADRFGTSELAVRRRYRVDALIARTRRG